MCYLQWRSPFLTAQLTGASMVPMTILLLRASMLRLLLMGWLTAGTLAVPLVHVHPEADHHHGQPGHAHGAVVHTIFSSDLPCEYGSDRGGPVVGQSTHVFDHPEVPFSLLTSSPDRSSGKPGLAGAEPVRTEDDGVRPTHAFATEPSVESPTTVILSASLSSRAPPLSAV